MHLLPFDPFSPRALSIALLGLIILVSQARDPARSGSSLVRNDQRSAPCAQGYVPSTTSAGWGCGGGRNTIQGGKLTVGTSF